MSKGKEGRKEKETEATELICLYLGRCPSFFQIPTFTTPVYAPRKKGYWSPIFHIPLKQGHL